MRYRRSSYRRGGMRRGRSSYSIGSRGRVRSRRKKTYFVSRGGIRLG